MFDILLVLICIVCFYLHYNIFLECLLQWKVLGNKDGKDLQQIAYDVVLYFAAYRSRTIVDINFILFLYKMKPLLCAF